MTPPLTPPSDPPPPVAVAAVDTSTWPVPWVRLKYFSYHPCIYPAMIKAVSPGAKPGELVTVYDRTGRRFGAGLYNPKARVPLRMLFHGDREFTEGDLTTLLDRALDLRLKQLDLPAHMDAFRVVHSDGDALSGLVVDKFSDVLCVQVHSLGIHQRIPQWLPRLHERLGTKRTIIEVEPNVAKWEGISVKKFAQPEVRSVKIREHGVRYEVDFEHGHKTGFFCDQRENRRRLAGFTKDKRMLDLCCYTGGFSLSAKVAGGATEVTGVDLDEKVIAQAKRNANLNQARIEWVHCDAFSWARQAQKNSRRFEVVVLDPPKLILSREDEFDGRRKYEDLNQLAVTLVENGGMLVTCSCSGLLSAEDFEAAVIRGAHRAGRRLQFLDRTGAGEDHPVMSNCPESRYLKVLWARVL